MSQITLNRSHWLARDLCHWWPQPENNAAWRDYGPFNHAALTVDAGTPIAKTSRVGRVSDFVLLSEFSESRIHSRIPGTFEFTIGLWAEFSAYQNNPAGVSLAFGASTADLVILYPNDDLSGNGPRVFMNDATRINDNSGPAVDTPHFYVYTQRSTTDGELFLDGRSIGTTSNPGAVSSSINEVQIGHWNGSQNYAHDMWDVTIHSRGMSAAEVAAWYGTDRWGLYGGVLQLIHADVPGPEVNAMIELPTDGPAVKEVR